MLLWFWWTVDKDTKVILYYTYTLSVESFYFMNMMKNFFFEKEKKLSLNRFYKVMVYRSSNIFTRLKVGVESKMIE